MKLSWNVNNVSGTAEIKSGANHIMAKIPADEILRVVKAQVAVPKAAKMYFNGYQTWTSCPEYTPDSRIRGLKGLPRFLVNSFSLDRYADYHFIDYPNKKGVLHGESYCYFRDGERYRLFASLDEKPGYTCFFYDCSTELLTITRDCAGCSAGALARSDAAPATLTDSTGTSSYSSADTTDATGTSTGGSADTGSSPAVSFPAFDLFYTEGTEAEVFDAWFDALGIHNRVPRIKGYSSWYNHYQDITEQGIYDDLKGAAALFDGGDLFQIDDGWEPFVGDWETTDTLKFPNGLKPVADAIHARGLKAGLWLAPFVCEEKSDLFRTHPDWLLKYDGQPWKDGCNWSGFYSLDIDHPEVQDYLTRVFIRVFDEWGFDLVKLDFLYAAAPFATGEDSTLKTMQARTLGPACNTAHASGPACNTARTYGPSCDAAHTSGPAFTESRAGRMIRALTFLRRLCGDRLILGCGTPVMPAFGLVDYCRIGGDVGLDWDDKPIMRIIHRERVSTKLTLMNTIFRRELDGRAHGNDPDVFFLRDNNIRLTAEEKLYLATVNALFGSVWFTSDNLSAYTPDKVQQYRTLARLRAEASDISVDPETLAVSYTLDGVRHTVRHPHK